MLAHFGTEALAGYGIGARLEFILTSIAFATGVASVPMVGMAVGAGLVTRARRVAWTAAAVAGLSVGLVGLLVAVKPALWVSLFTTDPGVVAARKFLFCVGRSGLGLFRDRHLPLFRFARGRQGRRSGACLLPTRLADGRRLADGGWSRSTHRPGHCSRWSAGA